MDSSGVNNLTYDEENPQHSRLLSLEMEVYWTSSSFKNGGNRTK